MWKIQNLGHLLFWKAGKEKLFRTNVSISRAPATCSWATSQLCCVSGWWFYTPVFTLSPALLLCHLQCYTVSAVSHSHLQFSTVTCSVTMSVQFYSVICSFALSQCVNCFVCVTHWNWEAVSWTLRQTSRTFVWHDSLFDCSVDTVLHTRLTDAGTGDAAATERETATSVSAPGTCGSWARWGEGGGHNSLFSVDGGDRLVHWHESAAWCVCVSMCIFVSVSVCMYLRVRVCVRVSVCVHSCMLAQRVYAICVCAHWHVLVSMCVQFVCGCVSVYVLTHMFWLAQFVCVSGGGRGTHLVDC